MSAPASQKPVSKNSCVVHVVANALATEPSLEAVTLDRENHAVSIAVLGKDKDDELAGRIAAKIEEIRPEATDHCGLLEGKKSCNSCNVPFAPFERQSIEIVHQPNATTISRVTCPTSRRFWKWKEIPWPRFGPREIEIAEEHDHEEEEWKQQLVAASLCGVLGVAGSFLGETYIATIAFILSYFAGSWFAAKDTWELLSKRKLDVHFLMLAVAFGSASIGAWGEGATLLFLFSFSSALEHYATGRTQREIKSLFKEAPKFATLLDGEGHEREVPVEVLRPGMRLLLRPDSQFPVDGEILKGQTAADESNLTGEATPIEKDVGDNVLAGTMNLWGAVEITVTRTAGESALQKIIRLIHEAQHLKAPAQRFTDKFGTNYTYGILGLSLLMFFVWWLGLGLPAFNSEHGRSAFYRTMTLLVVASPCALVLSIPSAVLAAIAWGARRGVLFRGGAAVEKLAQVKIVALDKTGTITTGELRVERVESFPSGRESEVAQFVYSLERLSNHPLARAITRYGKHEGLVPLPLQNFESIPGMGLKAVLNGKTIWLGGREWLQNKISPLLANSLPSTESGSSEVWLAVDGLVGRVLLRDDVRPQAQSVIEKLRGVGLRTVVLTGDRRAAGESLKAKLGLDDVRTELKPEQKVAVIEQFIKQGQPVAMIGDGVNDAPSLAAAHVGVAMGARGSDAALEQAEVVLMHDRLENFWAAFQLSKRARRIIFQNVTISLGTVVTLVTLAMFGIIPLTIGVVGHEGSTVVVVMNSLRLLFNRRD